jgi:hypothetical protein
VKNGKANVSDSTQSTLPKEAGFNSVIFEEIVIGGPGELRKAERKARKLAKLYGEQFEAKWFLETRWLKQMDAAHRARALCLAMASAFPRGLGALAFSSSCCPRSAHFPDDCLFSSP